MPREKQYASYKSLAPKDESKDSYTCMVIQDQHHRKKLITENSIVCIDLYSDTCEPCKIVSPQFAELAKQYNSSGKCILVKENVELNLTKDCDINGVPAFIFYKGRQLVRNNDGTPVIVLGGDIQLIRKILDKLLESN